MAYATLTLVLMALSLALVGFNGDALMDINIGQWILAHGRVPLHNYFTQALAGHPFSDTEWLFCVWIATAYHLGGRWGVYLSLLPYLVIVAGFVGIWTASLGPRRGLIVTVIAGFALTITMAPRPQLVSYAAFALGLWAIQQARHHHWLPLFLFLAIIPFWTNMHGSVVLAPALLANEVMWGASFPGYRWRMMLAVGTATGLMLCRIGGLAAGSTFFFHVFQPGVLNVIQEWQSPNFHTEPGWILWPILFLAWAVLFPQAQRQRQWSAMVWLGLGPLVTLWAIRFAPYMVLGVVAASSEVWHSSSETLQRSVPWVGISSGLATLWLALGIYASSQPWFFAQNYPVSAFAYLRHHHATHVVTPQLWGDAAEFAGLQPWTNGQAQLWASTRWWMPFVHIQHESAARAGAWARQWDPTARWIVWPISGYHLWHSSWIVPHWHLVYREHTPQGQVGVWHRLTTAAVHP